MKPFPNEHLVVSCLTVIEEDLDDEVSNVWMLLIIAQQFNPRPNSAEKGINPNTS